MQVFERTETSPAAPLPHAETEAPDFTAVEQHLATLIELENLDDHLTAQPALVAEFERALSFALAAVYDQPPATEAEAAQLFLQRVLYRINRLKLFWYDNLERYTNEQSNYLNGVRERIEQPWQAWETAQIDLSALREEADIGEALKRRTGEDLAPPVSADGLYFRERAGDAGYRRLLAIASLDGLVEASQLSRTLGGAANAIHAMMTRLLVEEYGGGRLTRKHSSFFAAMLSDLGMSTEPEFYFELVPWEVLAAINHSFLLSERKRFYLRYVGGLLYTEISVPAAFESYRYAAERLGVSAAARGYWELHIREDERHGRWMLHDVALPLAAMYPNHTWEILFGYDQQKLMSERAGASIARAVRAADAQSAVEPSRRDAA